MATALGIVVLSLGGLLVGWHMHASAAKAAGGYGLLLPFAFTMLWVGAFVGVSFRSPDAVMGIAFLLVFPLTFMASTFVPIAGLDGALRHIADYYPISTLAVATRTLFGNPTALPAPRVVAAGPLGSGLGRVVSAAHARGDPAHGSALRRGDRALSATGATSAPRPRPVDALVTSRRADEELPQLVFAIMTINAWNRLMITTRVEPGHFTADMFKAA